MKNSIPIQLGNVNPSGRGMNGAVYDASGVSPTLTTNKGEGLKVRVSAPPHSADGVIIYDDYNRRIKSDQTCIGTVMPNFKSDALGNGTKLIEPGQPAFRVRKLTAKECWRLMGFEDQDFERAKSAMNENIYRGKDKSGSQLYKQAGNSIVVDVLLHIMENLYDAMPYLFEDMVVGSFFSGIGAFEKALTQLQADHDKESAADAGSYPELTQIGYINDYNGDANRIYDSNVARVLKAEAGGAEPRPDGIESVIPPPSSNNSGCETVTPRGTSESIYERNLPDIGSKGLQRSSPSSYFNNGVIIDDTMGFESEPRTYEGICPSLRASRQGLKTIGIVDPQGRTKKRCTIQESCPTLRAETHGNPPCAVYHKTEE